MGEADSKTLHDGFENNSEADGVRNSYSDTVNDATSAGKDAPFYKDIDVLLTKLVELRGELDDMLGFDSKRTSIMFAYYPGGGAHYARHRDALPEHSEPRRRLTAVYYLNPSWTPAEGGCLRAYFPESVGHQVHGAHPVEDGATEWMLDIPPQLDRLVLFASDWLDHEVLPTYADRYAITMWLY